MTNVVSLFKGRTFEEVIGRQPSKRSPQSGWAKLQPMFKRHFLAKAQASEFEELAWGQLPEWVRKELIELIKENPRCGPDLGLVPAGGVYSTGESYFEAVQRKTKEGTWV